MKRHILIIVAALITLPLISCTINVDGKTFGGETIKGNGNIVTRNYDVTMFDEISVALPATVNFTVSNDYTCAVRVDENLLEYLDIKVKDNDLQLCKPKEHNNTSLRATEFVIEVTAPSLKDISLAGSGTLNVLSPLDGKELEVDLAGSGDIVLSCDIVDLDADIAGSGDIKARVSGQLEYSIIGSGDIGYYGKPVLKGSKAGSGGVTRLGE